MPRNKQEAMRRKRNRGRIKKEAPLPILTMPRAASYPPCIFYTGYLQGSSVIVHHSGDMEFLHKLGFFGKGSLSRSEPSFESRQQKVNLPNIHNWESDSDGRILPTVMSKRRYLAHCRYKALSDDEELEYQEVIQQEQKQLATFDQDEDYDDEEDEEDGESGEDILSAGASSHNDVTFSRSYLVALMTQVSLMTSERIATFMRVPESLASLREKYRLLRQKQVDYLEGLTQSYGPGSSMPPGAGFGKKGVINLEEGEDDPVVILNSDDSSKEEEEEKDEEEEKKKRETEEKTSKEKSANDWDDWDNEGDADFWGTGDEKKEAENNDTADATNLSKESSAKAPSAETVGSDLASECGPQKKEVTNGIQKKNMVMDTQSEKGRSQTDNAVPSSENGLQNTGGKTDTGPDLSSGEAGENKDADNVTLTNGKALVHNNDQKNEESKCSGSDKEKTVDTNTDIGIGEKCLESMKSNGDGDKPSIVEQDLTSAGTSKDNEMVSFSGANGESSQSSHKALPQTACLGNDSEDSDDSDDDDDDDDDVICMEEGSAQPDTLHQFLSKTNSAEQKQGRNPKIPLETKDVCFMTAITPVPKLIDARVGFPSWGSVIHFNFSGDRNHLPTVMGVLSEGEMVEDSDTVTPRCGAVYERVFPPINTLMVDSDSEGSVIKQRIDAIPCLDEAHERLQQVMKSRAMSFSASRQTGQPSAFSNSQHCQNFTKPALLPNQLLGHRGFPGSSSQSQHPLHHRQQHMSSFSQHGSQSRGSSLHHPNSSLRLQYKFSSALEKLSRVSKNQTKSGAAIHSGRSLTSSSSISVTAAQLHLYLQVFQTDNSPDGGSTGQENTDVTTVCDDDNSDEMLQNLHSLLKKAGLVNKNSSKVDNDVKQSSSGANGDEEEPDFIHLFNTALSDYLTSKRISLEQELCLLRVLMYDSSLGPTSIPQEVVVSAKSKLSPNQVSCLLERMDYIQNCLHPAKEAGSSGEVITIDLSDDDADCSETDTSAGGKKNSHGPGTAKHRDPTEKGDTVETRKRTLDSSSPEFAVKSSELKKMKISNEDVEKVSVSAGFDSSLGSCQNGDSGKDGLPGNVKDGGGVDGNTPEDQEKGVSDEEKSAFGEQNGERESGRASGVSSALGSNVYKKDSGGEVDVSSSKNVLDESKINVDKGEKHPGAAEAVINKKDVAGNQDSLEREDPAAKGKKDVISEDVKEKDSSCNKNVEAAAMGENVDAEGESKTLREVTAEGDNEVYSIGSSEEEGEDNSKRVTPKKRRKYLATRVDGVISSKRRKWDEDDEEEAEGDCFVVANTSDEEEYDLGEEEEEEGAAIRMRQQRSRWRPCVKKDPYRTEEKLYLMPEEAFFLTFGLGCLSVQDSEMKPLSVMSLWQQLMIRQERFVPRYVAYHYFRSKGWVPKAGLKFGCDFILYREGPPFYHGSYSVVVIPVKATTLDHMSGQEGQPDFSQRWTSWVATANLNRVTEHVSKELMLCYVIFPPGVTEEQTSSPKCLTTFKVKEVVVSRWVSAREREAKDPDEEIP